MLFVWDSFEYAVEFGTDRSKLHPRPSILIHELGKASSRPKALPEVSYVVPF